jgi:hypothetical protein
MRAQVSKTRRQVPSFLDAVIGAFTEEPAVQRAGEGGSKSALWDDGGLAPLPLLPSGQP